MNIQIIDVVDFGIVSGDTVKDHCNRLKTVIQVATKRMTCYNIQGRLTTHEVLTVFLGLEQVDMNYNCWTAFESLRPKSVEENPIDKSSLIIRIEQVKGIKHKTIEHLSRKLGMLISSMQCES